MAVLEYFQSLDPAALLRVIPGNIAQGIIWGIMALGVYITYKILDFADLTVDGSFATGGAVTLMLLLNGTPAPIALLCAMIAGCLCGLVTGLLHTLLGIPGILAGILTQIALYSINLNIMGKANTPVPLGRQGLVLLTARNNPKAIVIGLVFAFVIIAFCYWYFGTEQGSSIRATGSNANMAKAQGININFTKVLALALSNGLVALSGGLVSQYQGFADVKMGQGAIVIGLAAVIIGQVLFQAFFRKKTNFAIRLFFVVIGAVIYYLVIGVVLWLKMPSDDMKLFTAIIVAVFLAVPYLKDQWKTSFSRLSRENKKLLRKTKRNG